MYFYIYKNLENEINYFNISRVENRLEPIHQQQKSPKRTQALKKAILPIGLKKSLLAAGCTSGLYIFVCDQIMVWFVNTTPIVISVLLDVI